MYTVECSSCQTVIKVAKREIEELIAGSADKNEIKSLSELGKTCGPNDAGFRSSLEHVLSELKRVELKLQLRVRSLRKENSSEDAKFRGLYISDAEVDAILNDCDLQVESRGSLSIPADFKEAAEPVCPMEQSIEQSIEKKKQETRGVELRLDVLRDLFRLSQFDINTLLVCLLPEIDLRYQRIFAYLQDDITRKLPTVDLVLQLLCNSPESRIKAREHFFAGSPLIASELIHVQEDHTSGPVPLLGRFLSLDERITNYLLDIEQIDNHISEIAVLCRPKNKLADVVLPEELKSRLNRIILRFKNQGVLYCLSGIDNTLNQMLVEAICTEADVPLLQLDLSNLTTVDTPPEILLSRVFREGRLQNAAIFISEFSFLLQEQKEDHRLYKRVIRELHDYPQWVFISAEKEWRSGEVKGNKPIFNIDLSAVSYPERWKIWDQFTKDEPKMAADVNLKEIAGKFKFTSGQINSAIDLARNMALWRDPLNEIITSEDLHAACRKQSREKLNSLARKIKPNYRWEDIILPSDQMEQLREIANYVAQYHTVYSDWGFGRKLSTGKGLNVMFAGVSGTGKTMAAEVIASALGIDLYKIDLSNIVSKYIGETEKNLDRIFHEGQASNAILFFDEADALFGKRSEVRDSHDRYANIEVAYLLQKMDEYEGIVILATNLRKNMDEAFARRMHYTLEFPIPEEADRYRIWQNIFPSEAPLSKDLDLKFMARQFKITGGNIRNIALNAAFLATMNGGVIETTALIRATKREFQKIGKLCTEGDFAQYFELVKT